MKGKMFWVVTSLLIVMAMLLVSCGESKTETKPSETTTKEKPVYGGTATFIFASASATNTFDPIEGSQSGFTWQLTYENLVMPDWSRGPEGTNEFTFATEYVSPEFFTGCLAESWEVLDNRTVVFHLRKGIHWQNIPPVNGREFNADDVVYTWHRNTTVGGVFFSEDENLMPKCTKIDDYTVQLKWFEPYVFALHDAGRWVPVFPRELVDQYGDLNDWKHQCGTGAFMLVDCVTDSSVTWKKNPNYWMYDPLHPENRLPYIETITGLVVPDEASQLACIRTYKVDRAFVSWNKADGVKSTNPELLVKKLDPDESFCLFMRTDLKPFSDQRVRQALSLAVDQNAIARDYYSGHAITLNWPLKPGQEGYTPLEELPVALRELYEYHPDKAKLLLTKAGYPEGITVEAITSNPQRAEILAIVKENLKNAGVDMSINLVEPGTFSSLLFGKSYPSMIVARWSAPLPTDPWGWAHGAYPVESSNFSNVVDPIAREVWTKYHNTADPKDRAIILKKETLRAMELCWEIALPAPCVYLFWGPWLKGYQGERSMGPNMECGREGIWQFIWIDQELKAKTVGE